MRAHGACTALPSMLTTMSSARSPARSAGESGTTNFNSTPGSPAERDASSAPSQPVSPMGSTGNTDTVRFTRSVWRGAPRADASVVVVVRRASAGLAALASGSPALLQPSNNAHMTPKANHVGKHACTRRCYHAPALTERGSRPRRAGRPSGQSWSSRHRQAVQTKRPGGGQTPSGRSSTAPEAHNAGGEGNLKKVPKNPIAKPPSWMSSSSQSATSRSKPKR
jgi:hypothetical protein